MVVEVTQKHINKGLRNDCRRCPIALALKDAGLSDVVVMRSIVLIHPRRGSQYRYSCALPTSVSQFIESFDSIQGVEPFSFELEVA
jgi:hypothetical protein